MENAQQYDCWSRRNILLLIAAAILFLVGTMHTIRAEWIDRRLVRRIVQSSLFDADSSADQLARQIVRLAWHLTSIVWCGIAVLMVYLSSVEQVRPIVVTIRIFAVIFALHALASLIFTRGRHPSWYLFLIVATCLLLSTEPVGRLMTTTLEQ